jgi:hypothetical protein
MGAVMNELGFVVTPQEIADRIASLDGAISALTAQVDSTDKVTAAWAAEYRAFTRRWAVERDSYADWSSRLFATRVLPRIEAFEQTYRWWARDFERKTHTVVRIKPAAPVSGLVPWWVWALGIGAVLIYARSVSRGR